MKMHPCPIRFRERLLREPLVDWESRPLPLWAELVGSALSILLFFLMLGFVAWQPKMDR